MKELKNRLMISFTLIMFASGWGMWFVIENINLVQEIPNYPIMPFLFYILGILFINSIFGSKRDNSIKLAQLYMLLKIVKMFVFGAVAVIYMFNTEVDKKSFAIVFSVFFIVYTAFETVTIHKLEQEIKKNKNA